MWQRLTSGVLSLSPADWVTGCHLSLACEGICLGTPSYLIKWFKKSEIAFVSKMSSKMATALDLTMFVRLFLTCEDNVS
jgi:hypothetical protein